MDLQRVSVDRRVVARWQGRTRAERASAREMADIAHRVQAHLPDGSRWAAALERAAEDESRHARRCEAMLGQLGGVLDVHGEPGLPPTGEGTPLEGLLEHVVFLLCAGESIAAAMLAEASRGARPEVTLLLDGIRADEVRHGLLGWRLLDALLDAHGQPSPALAERCAKQVLRAVVAAARVPPAGPEGRHWGLLSPDQAEAIAKATVIRHIGPALRQRGLWPR